MVVRKGILSLLLLLLMVMVMMIGDGGFYTSEGRSSKRERGWDWRSPADKRQRWGDVEGSGDSGDRGVVVEEEVVVVVVAVAEGCWSGCSVVSRRVGWLVVALCCRVLVVMRRGWCARVIVEKEMCE